jgi:hypothetical protein
VSARVSDFDAGEAEAPFAEWARPASPNLDEHSSLGSRLEVGEQADRTIPVAVREAAEDVSDGVDASFRSRFGKLRADPAERLERGGQNTRSRPVDRGAQQLGAA